MALHCRSPVTNTLTVTLTKRISRYDLESSNFCCRKVFFAALSTTVMKLTVALRGAVDGT